MIEVLVVDDSAVVREVLASLLARSGEMHVTVASDPLIAQQKMKSLMPDVVVLDLEMPRMDGLTFLRTIMAEHPLPVVVYSALAGNGTAVAVAALEEGAVDVITKPVLGVSEFLSHEYGRILQAVRSAAGARARSRAERSQPAPVRPAGLAITTDKVIAIGASTGGTEAVKVFLQSMPTDAPGIVVVQHMPEIFTRAFANRLDECCAIEVCEAADGQRLTPGLALIAPGNRHLSVRRSGAHYAVHLDDGPRVSRHRPSVDVLFGSVATAAGANAVGIIMTGMGADGAEGLLQMKLRGAHTIAQNEATSIVFGMPKEAILRGAAVEVLPLERIPGAALRAATEGAGLAQRA